MPSSSSSRSSTAHCVSAPGAGTWPPTSSATAFERRVAQQRHGRLQLAEAERDGAGGVGGQQQRVVDAVRDVRLDRGRAAHAHLLHRREQLDRGEQREHAREPARRHAGGQARDLAPRRVAVDEHAREGDLVERHRLLGHGEVDAAARDELVEQVELGLGLAVELDDATVLDAQRRLGIVGARERDQAERGILGNEVVAADRPRRVELRAERGARAHGAYGSGRAASRAREMPRQEAGVRRATE